MTKLELTHLASLVKKIERKKKVKERKNQLLSAVKKKYPIPVSFAFVKA